MTGGFNCLKNFSKLFTSNYMSYLIKKFFLNILIILIILQNGI